MILNQDNDFILKPLVSISKADSKISRSLKHSLVPVYMVWYKTSYVHSSFNL